MSDEAIPAATLILIRDREQGAPQVLMVERSRDMAFAAGAMVFPGGRIDPSDHRLAAEFATQAPLLAAIRETLEETASLSELRPFRHLNSRSVSRTLY